MREFKSFYKTVTGNEGEKCHYPTRLDTYGCGCAHDCKYCYAKSLLEFRGFWDPLNPSVASISKIENKVKTLKKGSVLRLGGMTDCFQPCEKQYGVTYETIKLLNKYGIHYLIVTKSDLVADDKYIDVMDKTLAHIQVTVTSTDDWLAATYEKATPPSLRIAAIEKLEALGFDVQIRLSPFMPEYLDFDIINKIKCHKALVEFLRINTFIKKTFPGIDYSKYTHKEGGYYHLELEEKIRRIKLLTGFQEISVCEDCTEAYNYWTNNINHNKGDCCNLRMPHKKANNGEFKTIGNIQLMQQKKTAFLCSLSISDRTEEISLQWALRQAEKGHCIISGFQSPVEKKVLDVLLKNNGNAIMVLPKGMFEQCPSKLKEHVDNGHLLIVSYFDDDQKIVTRASAELRNQKVIELSDNIVVGCMKRSGMTERLIARTDKPCFVLDPIKTE